MSDRKAIAKQLFDVRSDASIRLLLSYLDAEYLHLCNRLVMENTPILAGMAQEVLALKHVFKERPAVEVDNPA